MQESPADKRQGATSTVQKHFQTTNAALDLCFDAAIISQSFLALLAAPGSIATLNFQSRVCTTSKIRQCFAVYQACLALNEIACGSYAENVKTLQSLRMPAAAARA